MDEKEFEEFVKRNPEEALRLIVKAFKPKELLKVGNRSYVNAFKYPESRFDAKDLMLDGGGSLQVLKNPDMLQPLRDPGKVFTDQTLIPPSQLVFSLAGRFYSKSGMPETAGMISGGLTDAASLIQNAINSLPNVSGSELGESGTGKSGKIFIKQGIYYINSSIVIPPFSWVSIEGETKSMGQTMPFGGTVLVGAPGITVLSFPRGSYGYQHTRARIAHLSIRFDTGNVNNVGIDLRGTFVAEVHDVGLASLSQGYGIGIYARAGGVDHLHYYHDIDIAGFRYGFYVVQNHAIIYAISITNCGYGLFIGESPFVRGAIGSVQLMNNVVDLYASGSNAEALFIDKLYLEHSGMPPAPILITNSQRLIVIGCLTWAPPNATISQMIDNINYVKVLSGRIDRHGGTPLLLRNSGTATIAAGSTSVTVAHGLAATPTKVIVTPRGDIGSVWVSARDSTNITISCSTAPTVDTLVDWYAEV